MREPDTGDEAPTYDRQVDMWSIGMVAYLTLTSRFPFDASTEADLCSQIVEARSVSIARPPTRRRDVLTHGRALGMGMSRFDKLSSQWRVLPAQARDFISRLLVVNPAERMTAEAALLHPWLARGGDTEPARRPSAAMQEAPGRRTSTTPAAAAPARRTSTVPGAPLEAAGSKESSRRSSAAALPPLGPQDAARRPSTTPSVQEEARRTSTQDLAARKGGPTDSLELERRASTAAAAQPTQSAPTSARPSRSGTPTLPAAKPSSS